MLHRALFGSLERFIGILLEHYSGHLPLWLSPTHAVVASITDQTRRLREDGGGASAGRRAARRRRPAQREDRLQGARAQRGQDSSDPRRRRARETEQSTVSLRRLGSRDQEILALDEAVTTLCQQAASPLSRLAAQEGTG